MTHGAIEIAFSVIKQLMIREMESDVDEKFIKNSIGGNFWIC